MSTSNEDYSLSVIVNQAFKNSRVASSSSANPQQPMDIAPLQYPSAPYNHAAEDKHYRLAKDRYDLSPNNYFTSSIHEEARASTASRDENLQYPRVQSRIARKKRSIIHQQKRTQAGLSYLRSRLTTKETGRARREHKRGATAADDKKYGSEYVSATATTSSNDHLLMNRSSREDLEYQLQKVLSPSDVGSLGRIVLPKMDAQKFLPPLGEAESKVLEVEDFLGCRIWNFKFRYWPNNKSRMYLFENTGEFVKYHGLEKGDKIVLYKDPTSRNYVICTEKSSKEISDFVEQAHPSAHTSLYEAFKQIDKRVAPIIESTGQQEWKKDIQINNMMTIEDTTSGAQYQDTLSRVELIDNITNDFQLEFQNKIDEDHDLFLCHGNQEIFYVGGEISLRQQSNEDPNANIDEELEDLFKIDQSMR